MELPECNFEVSGAALEYRAAYIGQRNLSNLRLNAHSNGNTVLLVQNDQISIYLRLKISASNRLDIDSAADVSRRPNAKRFVRQNLAESFEQNSGIRMPLEAAFWLFSEVWRPSKFGSRKLRKTVVETVSTLKFKV